MLIQKVFAGGVGSPGAAIPVGEIFTFPSINSIGTLFEWLTNLLIILGFGLVIVFLAMGFIRFITSQGDKEATQIAQKWVSYAALGGVGLLAVYTLKAIILNITGAGGVIDRY